MKILAIDPGPEESAYVFLLHQENSMPKLHDFAICSNSAMKDIVSSISSATIVIEKIASYGMAVGESVFETCVWTGRFIEAARCPVERIPRKDVKLQLCMSLQAKDANIRAALIDRYGGPAAIKKDGPLYKVSKDVWAALAVGVTYWETRRLRESA